MGTVTKPVHGYDKDGAMEQARKLHGHLGEPVDAEIDEREEDRDNPDMKNLYNVTIKED
jgi:hypothetical protein